MALPLWKRKAENQERNKGRSIQPATFLKEKFLEVQETGIRLAILNSLLQREVIETKRKSVIEVALSINSVSIF